SCLQGLAEGSDGDRYITKVELDKAVAPAGRISSRAVAAARARLIRGLNDRDGELARGAPAATVAVVAGVAAFEAAGAADATGARRAARGGAAVAGPPTGAHPGAAGAGPRAARADAARAGARTAGADPRSPGSRPGTAGADPRSPGSRSGTARAGPRSPRAPAAAGIGARVDSDRLTRPRGRARDGEGHRAGRRPGDAPHDVHRPRTHPR